MQGLTLTRTFSTVSVSHNNHYPAVQMSIQSQELSATVLVHQLFLSQLFLSLPREEAEKVSRLKRSGREEDCEKREMEIRLNSSEAVPSFVVDNFCWSGQIKLKIAACRILWEVSRLMNSSLKYKCWQGQPCYCLCQA